MHHHGMDGQGVLLPAVMLAMLAMATAVHLRAEFAGRPGGHPGHALGHAVMAAGMAYMLLPAEWRPIPNLGLAVVFAASAAYFVGASVVAWRSGGRGIGWHAELAVSDVAMVYMLGPSRFVSAPLTALLVVYFCIYAIPFAVLVLWRGLVIDLPGDGQATQGATRRPLSRLARAFSSLSTSSAAAHVAMATVMLYMLTGLQA